MRISQIVPARLRDARWLGLFVATVVVGSACTDAPGVTSSLTTVARSEVTDAVAASMTPTGRFILFTASVLPPGQLSEAAASAIAKRYVSDMAGTQSARWSRESGATVDPTTIRLCDRALYAATPYATVIGAESELALRRFDAHWVVPVCAQRGAVQMVISFSALAIELADSVNSPTSLMPWGRADILSFGVPQNPDAVAMFSPEGAVHYAFARTGKRISSVPALVMAPNPKVPSLLRWRIDVESPVTLVGASSSSSRQRTQMFVGFGDLYSMPGLLDFDPRAARPRTNWTDNASHQPIGVVLKREAPVGIELISRVTP
jgi:hypothetical protein